MASIVAILDFFNSENNAKLSRGSCVLNFIWLLCITAILNYHAGLFFLFWVERPLQHISGHIRTVPACNRGYDNHFIVISVSTFCPDYSSRTMKFSLLTSAHIVYVPIWTLEVRVYNIQKPLYSVITLYVKCVYYQNSYLV